MRPVLTCPSVTRERRRSTCDALTPRGRSELYGSRGQNRGRSVLPRAPRCCLGSPKQLDCVHAPGRPSACSCSHSDADKKSSTVSSAGDKDSQPKKSDRSVMASVACQTRLARLQHAMSSPHACCDATKGANARMSAHLGGVAPRAATLRGSAVRLPGPVAGAARTSRAPEVSTSLQHRVSDRTGAARLAVLLPSSCRRWPPGPGSGVLMLHPMSRRAAASGDAMVPGVNARCATAATTRQG